VLVLLTVIDSFYISLWGDQIYTYKDYLSLILLVASSLLWLIVLLPQVFLTYKTGSVEPENKFTMFVWILGDVFNVSGCVLSRQLPIQTILACMFLMTTTFTVVQQSYYSYYSDIEDQVYRYHERPNHHMKLWGSSITVIMTIFLIIAGVYDFLAEYYQDLGRVLGWFMCISYMSSSLPDLYKTVRYKRFYSISRWSYILSLFASLFYLTAVLLHRSDSGYSLPWIIDSSFSIVQGAVVLGLCYFWGKDTVILDDVEKSAEKLSLLITAVPTYASVADNV